MFFGRVFNHRKNKLGEKIELYLQHLGEAAHYFKKGLEAYLNWDQADFESCCAELNRIEKEADHLLNSIRHHIYTYMLYPNIQKDICKLLNVLDDIFDAMKQILIQLSIEKPDIPEFLKKCFSQLTDSSCCAVDEITTATSCFFCNLILVEDHVNKVVFYENEADKLEQKIKYKVHNDCCIESLSHKDHLCHFTAKIALPSDKAYRVAKDLLIYSIDKDSYADYFI